MKSGGVIDFQIFCDEFYVFMLYDDIISYDTSSLFYSKKEKKKIGTCWCIGKESKRYSSFTHTSNPNLGWECSSVVAYLSSMCKAMDLISHTVIKVLIWISSTIFYFLNY